MIFEIEHSPANFDDASTYVILGGSAILAVTRRLGIPTQGRLTGAVLASRIRMGFSTKPRPDDIHGRVAYAKAQNLLALALRAGQDYIVWS